MAATLEVTTLASAKEYRNTSGSGDDNQLTQLIKLVSSVFEEYLNRVFKTDAAIVEYFDVYPNKQTFYLKGYPVTSVTNVWNDHDLQFTTATPSDDYVLLDSRRIVFRPNYLVFSGRSALKVQYAGGMADDTATFITDFPEITTAANMQITYMFSKIREEDLIDVALSGKSSRSSSRASSRGDLLPQVRNILDRYRNFPTI